MLYICIIEIQRRGVSPETVKKLTIMNAGAIYNGLAYTTRSINMNFKIKVNGVFNGKKINTLVGVSGLINLIGIEMVNTLLHRAFRCMGDKEVCKLRKTKDGFRDLKVTFYYH